ncbi:MAG: pitrilysin family protein, partial [Pseudomonadota bacterium]
VLPAIYQGLARFEQNGISEEDLSRIKAGIEAQFYGGVQSALGKAINLGEYNLFADDPGFIITDIENTLKVTTADVMRAYEIYVKDKPYIVTSFVPKGEAALALEGAARADVVEEPLFPNAVAAAEFDPTVRDFERTPSSFDRTVEPPYGAPYDLPTPEIWRSALDNGVEVIGVENNETPLVAFSLVISAGRDRGDAAKPAVASLTGEMLQKGTAKKSVAELEDAIKSLGSSISIGAGQFGVYVSGETLSRNFDATIALVEEMLLEPRWDAEEFALLKRARLNQIDQDAGEPRAISSREAAKLLYPDDHVFSYRPSGTREKLETVTLNDLKAFYNAHYAPAGAKLSIVGDADSGDVERAFAGIARRWRREGSPAPTLPQPRPVEQSRVYFYDVPGAKQSVIRVQRPSLPATDPDYPLARAMNYFLGDIYTSKLNTELRVNKGYTYGAGSSFTGRIDRGVFSVNTSVRSNVTLESVVLIRDILSTYGDAFTEEDLALLKGALLRTQALQTETLDRKLDMISSIRDYGYPDDYPARNAKRIEAMTLAEFKALADRLIRPEAMDWLIIGDAESQAARLSALGFGEPVMLNAAPSP